MTKQSTNNHKTRTARTLVHVLLLSVSTIFIFSPQANAQTISENDRPVAASSSTDNARSDNKGDSLHSRDIAPVPLSGPKPIYILPEDVKRESSRNRWNAKTLTQTNGSNARRSSEPDTGNGRRSSSDVFPRRLTVDPSSPTALLSQGAPKAIPIANLQVVQPLEDGIGNFQQNVRDSLFDFSGDSVNASVFKLDLGEQLCLGTAEECEANVERKIDVGYSKNLTHGKSGGLNLQLTPRAGLRFNEDSKSALVGALVRIGDNLREGSEIKSNAWYLFAGADAEAMTYTPAGLKRLTSGEFHLQDRIIVGDAQAGVGYRLGEADLALSYFKRQAHAENYSYNEDAAALSVTWKR